MNLRIHRLAIAEIDHEVDYYEARQIGLGAELEDELDAVFATILRFPEAAPQWKDRADRRMSVAVLDRFPFTIPYQIKGAEIGSHIPAAGLATGHDDVSVESNRARDRSSPLDPSPKCETRRSRRRVSFVAGAGFEPATFGL